MDRRLSDRPLGGGVTMHHHGTMHQQTPAVRQDVGVTMHHHGTMHQQPPPVRQLSAGGLTQYCYDSATPIDNSAPEVRQVAGDGQTHYAAGGAPIVHQLSKNEGMTGQRTPF